MAAIVCWSLRALSPPPPYFPPPPSTPVTKGHVADKDPGRQKSKHLLVDNTLRTTQQHLRSCTHYAVGARQLQLINVCRIFGICCQWVLFENLHTLCRARQLINIVLFASVLLKSHRETSDHFWLRKILLVMTITITFFFLDKTRHFI